MKAKVTITKRPIDPGEVLDSVADRTAGGTVVFVGTVRNQNHGKRVVGLEYEAYKEMAESSMAEIAKDIGRRWPVRKLAMVHRVGSLEVGEASVVVAASAEHRAEAFEACRYGIDTIKTTLPLWKRETFSGGAKAWTEGTPIGRLRA